MNIERMKILRDKLRESNKLEIRGEVVGFDMGSFKVLDDNVVPRHCDTAGCIAGWAVVLFDPIAWKDPDSSIEILGQRILDLGDEERQELFFIAGTKLGLVRWGMSTNEKAAQALDNMIKTGSANWQEVLLDA